METLTRKPNKSIMINKQQRQTKLYVQVRSKKTTKDKTLQLDHSSSDESCVMLPEDSESDTSLNELAQKYEADFNEEREDNAFLQETHIEICAGEWVLVSFLTKRMVKNFVGQIISMADGLPTVKFLRRMRSSSFFVWQQEKISQTYK